MKLTCFTLGHGMPEIRPASPQRAWMDETPQKFAYRCLPLTIANSSGWEILCPTPFTAEWNGNQDLTSIRIEGAGGAHEMPLSHFGSGILTFHVNALFFTEPGYNLYVGGPVNEPKDGIYPLTGVIETDWSPYTFTMNWKFTRPGTVRFEKGEPFCFFFPIPRDLPEAVEPVVRELKEEPQLEAAYKAWSKSRSQFNASLKDPASQAVQEKWQKIYYVGEMPDSQPGTKDHRIKLRLRPFVESKKKEK